METVDKKGKRRLKHRMLAAAGGLTAAAALCVGALFDSPDELLAPADSSLNEKDAVVSVKAPAARPQTLSSRLRAFFLRQSALVRGLVLLPLWVVGQAVLSALSLLLGALSPHWAFLLGVLGNALLLFALFAFVYKGLFPGARLTELFKKRRWLWLAGGALLLAAVDAALRLHWTAYAAVSLFIKLFCGFLALVTLSFRIFGGKTAQV